MFKSKLSKAYIVIEATLLLALIVLDIVTIAEGKSIMDKSVGLWNYIGAIKISLTSISLLTLILAFFLNRGKRMRRLDLFLIYFALTTTADVFFSFPLINWLPHLFFLITYILFVFIRKGKWYELSIPLVLGVIAFLIMHFVVKMELMTALIDSLLGATLLTNCVYCYLNYVRKKERFYLILGIATTLILISDASIVGSAFIHNPLALHNAVAMVNWPFYVSGNVIYVCFYIKEKTASI
ncbi:MAG: hypothetical protein K6B65_06665 [Bacilli bacterium]|nr:hypothetical protein [Bacilli bacterium]